jgi:GT2 family glycosyltransferase
MFERLTIGGGAEGMGYRADRFAEAIAGDQAAASDPEVRARLGHVASELLSIRFTGYRMLTALQRGQIPGPEAGLGKVTLVNAGIAALDLRELDGIFVMNPDCRLRPDTLHQLADALRPPGRAIAVPRLLNPGGSLQPSLRRNPTVWRALAEAIIGGDRAGRIGSLGELVMDPHEYDHPGPAMWATGAAMLLSAEAIRDLGPWDESFLLYSEETEYCLRAAERGWALWYDPAAVVEHIGGHSGTNPTLYALMVTNKVRLFRRQHSGSAGFLFYLTIILGESIRAAAGRRTSRAAVVALLKPSRRRTLITSITRGIA